VSARLKKIGRPLALGLVLLLAAEMAGRAGWLPATVPSPGLVAKTLVEDIGLLWFHAQATLLAAALGFTIALLLCLVLIALVAFFPALESLIYNFALVLHTLPLLVLAPILVIWFGLGMETRVILSALAAYYAILIAGLHGLRASAGRVTELMHLLSASRAQVFRMVTVPYALPALFAGLKIGATGAVLGAVISEWTGAERGLGLMMSYALFSFHVPRVWLTMFATMLLAVCVYSLVQLVENRLLAWHRNLSGLGGALA
jgi:ABC-type nitrate/sulfonate/bicarbonate transport system permease component